MQARTNEVSSITVAVTCPEVKGTWSLIQRIGPKRVRCFGILTLLGVDRFAGCDIATGATVALAA